MAAKQPPNNERSERSKNLLPCISEDELLKQPLSSRESKPKSSTKRARVNSEPNMPSDKEMKNASVKSADVDEDEKGKILVSNRRRVFRHGSLPVGCSKEKPDSSNTKEVTKEPAIKKRISRKKIQQVKPPSPDIIDLSNEKVVQELLSRLYETLRVTDKDTRELESAVVEQNDWKGEECMKYHPSTRSKSDNKLNLHRQHAVKFPRLGKSTSNLEVFYSKPLSWKSLKTRQLQRNERFSSILALKDSPTNSSQPEQKEMLCRQASQFTWPYRDYTRTECSGTVLRGRGLSVPLLMRPSNAFVSSKLFKTSFESRKSVTFAV